MNRRGFLGLLGLSSAAVVAAKTVGLPETELPKGTMLFFNAPEPPDGWKTIAQNNLDNLGSHTHNISWNCSGEWVCGKQQR